MSLFRRHKVILSVIAGVTLIAYLLLMPMLGELLRGHLETKIRAASQTPTRLGGVSIHLLPLGVTLSDLTLGERDPAAGGEPLLHVDTFYLRIPIQTLFDGRAHFTAASISGLGLSLVVDADGHSNLGRLLHQAPSGETGHLSIGELVIRDIHLSSYIDRSLMPFAPPEGEADGTVAIRRLCARNLVWPPFDEERKQPIWIQTEMEGVVCTAPTEADGSVPGDALIDGAQVERVTLALAPGALVRVKDLEVQGLEAATVYTTEGRLPALPRALAALFFWGESLKRDRATLGEGADVAPELSGILIESLTLRKSRYEIRGPDLSGQNAYWRLTDLTVDGKNLALGVGVGAPDAGQLLVVSRSESSSGPGQLRLNLTNLTGGYPRSSFDLQYQVTGIAAPPFTVVLKEANGPGIAAGQIDITFVGPCREGALDLNGDLTLSPDFRVDASMVQLLAGLQRGSPIGPIRLLGTLEQPEFSWPSAMAGAFGTAMEQILVHGPISGIKTSGAFVGSTLKQGALGSVKGVQRAGSAFGRFVEGVFDDK